MDYWFYLPDEEAANGLAQELGQYGLVVKLSRPSANQKDWVLVVQGEVDFDVTLARDIFEPMAEEYGGFYDGWEMTVPKGAWEKLEESGLLDEVIEEPTEH